MNRSDLGKWGEEKASEFLTKHGYFIAERNFRCRHGEIDIVAIKGDFLCFTEVKTRTSVYFGLPCEAVDSRKQARIKKVAQYYMLSHPESAKFSPRTDIIEILCLPDGKYIRHLLGAF